MLVSGILLEAEWQQVFSGLSDSFKYSSQSKQCCCLDSLYLSSNIQLFKSNFQAFGDYS